jgi:hypothetical protein
MSTGAACIRLCVWDSRQDPQQTDITGKRKQDSGNQTQPRTMR